MRKMKWLGFLVLAVAIIIGSIFIIKYISDDHESLTVSAITQPPDNAVGNSVYSPVTPEAKTLESSSPKVENKTFRITAVGDILLGRGVGSRLKSGQKDFKYPFVEVADILKKGDIVFGNLEEPITSSTHSLLGISQGGKYVLKNDVEAIEGLNYAGFNLFNLANNHILDYYEQGLLDTMSILDEHGIAYSGAGRNIDEARKPAVVERKNTKVGMLAYTDMAEVTYKGNPPLMFIAGKDKFGVAKRPLEFDEALKRDIEAIRDEVDILIVSLHWGVEESFEVLPQQRKFAYDLLDNGVDIILGHHPHQFHGIEIYKGKPIFYSLGNFIFDQNDPENQEAFIIHMNYNNCKLTDIEAIPVRTVGKTQIVVQKGEEAKAILDREVKLCKELDTECIIEEDKLFFELN